VTVVIFIAIGILAGLIFSYSTLQKIARIYQTPSVYVSALPLDGHVEVVGKADGKNTKSLLKHTNCCLWQVTIEEQRRRSKGAPYWVTIYTRMSEESFDLTDGKEKIQIFPANAHLILHDDMSKTSSFLNPLPPRIQNTLKDFGIDTAPGLLGFERPLRVKECIIKPGDEVYILGEVQYESGIKSIKNTDDSPLIISDHTEREVIGTLFRVVVVNILKFGFSGAMVFFLLQSFK